MPFTLIPISITPNGNEVFVRGRLMSGAYFGPEVVMLRSADGSEHATHIRSHGTENPEDWPVLPEHSSTILILRIPAPPDGFEPVLVTGLGCVQPAKQRVDISRSLDEPAFWAMQMALHFDSDVDDPALEYLGVERDAANEWYELNVNRPQLDGAWPYLRISLSDSKYIELELAAGVECQDRIWIGDLSESERVLLGYHSGHFSLPALRLSEADWLSAETDGSPVSLLWLFACYLESGSYPVSLASELLSQIPGIRPGKARPMAELLLERLAIENFRWSLDPALGWINAWPYSQRNPHSRLSILSAADFAYIREFFP